MAVNTSQSKALWGDISYIPAQDVVPDMLVLTQALQGPVIDGDAPMVRIPYVSEDPEAAQVNEGAKIGDATPVLTELTVSTRKLAVLTQVSNESYTDKAAPLLTDSLRRAVQVKADHVFLAQDPPVEGQVGVTGIFNYPGITKGGNIGGSDDAFDPIIEAIGAIGNNGGTPTSLIMGYSTWAFLLKLKDANGHPFLTQDVINAPTPTIYGLPVVLSNQCPADKILVNSKNEVITSAGLVQVATSSDAYFDSDSVGVRVTFRFGYGIVHPNRLAIVTTNTTTTK